MRTTTLLLIAASLLNVNTASACKCLGGSSVCGAFATADVVFTGRVESLEPDLNQLDFERRMMQVFPGRDVNDIEKDDSPTTVVKLKSLYSEYFSEPARSRILASATRGQLESTLEDIMDEGARVRFRTQVNYKGIAHGVPTVEVKTDFHSCGLQFSKGETYLVYADRNEKGELETGACSRTGRLTDAGEDLAYLHFIQNGSPGNGRVFGFLTGSEADLRGPPFWDRVSKPIFDQLVQLKGNELMLHTSTNTDGRFIFDGLAPGEYELAAVDGDTLQPLSGARRLVVEENSCKFELFYFRNPEPKK